MPVEPSPYWWPIAIVACAIVGIGAVWFTRFVVDRLDADRTRGDHHETKLEVHDLKIEEHDTAIKELKGERRK